MLAASEGEAYENLGKVSVLEQMLYPSYTEVGSATTLSQAPLIRVKVMNLLVSNFNSKVPDTDSESNPRNVFYNSYKTSSDAKDGLLGVIDNLNINHNLEGDEGVFFKRSEEGGVASPVSNTILPKFIDVNLSFSPIHEKTIGWEEDGKPSQSLFPYGVITDDTSPVAAERFSDYSTYNAQVEKDNADDQARKLRQQQADNARARYGGVLGDLRLQADVRRGSDGNEKAKARLRGRAAALEEDMEARRALTELIASDFLETL